LRKEGCGLKLNCMRYKLYKKERSYNMWMESLIKEALEWYEQDKKSEEEAV